MTKLDQYIQDHDHCKRAEVIQAAIDKHEFESYVEIGVNTGACFNKIDCKEKIGVDPEPKVSGVYGMTSDEFFKENEFSYDCYFIDGLHQSEQVYRDIVNALKYLNEGGIIFVHDCNPPVKEITCRERKDKDVKLGGAIWCGDVWKGYLTAIKDLPPRDYKTFDVDWGVGMIKPKGKLKLGEIIDYDWDYFNQPKKRRELLNLQPF